MLINLHRIRPQEKQYKEGGKARAESSERMRNKQALKEWWHLLHLVKDFNLEGKKGGTLYLGMHKVDI